MTLLLLLSLATAWLAFTVSETALFAPLRQRAGRRNPWMGKLLSCGYCLSPWFAAILVAFYDPQLFRGGRLLDPLLTALVIAWLAAFQWAALCWLLERAGK